MQLLYYIKKMKKVLLVCDLEGEKDINITRYSKYASVHSERGAKHPFPFPHSLLKERALK
jgi:hypothetical protein